MPPKVSLKSLIDLIDRNDVEDAQDKFYEFIVGGVVKALSSEHCSIFMYDTKSNGLILRGSTSEPLKHHIGKLVYKLSNNASTFTSKAVTGGQPVRVRSLEKQSGVPNEMQDPGLTVAVAPIRTKDSIIGCIRVLRRHQRYDAAEIEKLESFAEGLCDIVVSSGKFDVYPQLIYQANKPSIQLANRINPILLKHLKEDPKKLFELSPRKYEELIAKLLENDGWETQLTLQTRDGGYDIRAVRTIDGLQFSLIVEAKRWTKPVGVGVLRELYAVKRRLNDSKAMLATTSYVTDPALNDFSDVIPWELEIKEYDDLVDWLKRCKDDVSLD